MENNAVDSFLGDLKADEKDVFNQPVEVKKEVEEAEKPIPFNQDPKIAKFIEREVEKKLKDYTPTATETFREETKAESDDILDTLTRIVGNDTPEKISAVKDLRRALGSLEEKGAERALKQLQEDANEERQAEVEAQNELADGFADIESTFNVDLTSQKAQDERSKFVDFIKEVAPKDDDGQVMEYPDLVATYKLFKQVNKPDNSRAKDLASRSMGSSKDATLVPTGQGKSWSDVDKFFNSLSK